MPPMLPFPLSACAGKPAVKPITWPKMTTNDDIFATDPDWNVAISTGYGVSGVEK